MVSEKKVCTSFIVISLMVAASGLWPLSAIADSPAAQRPAAPLSAQKQPVEPNRPAEPALGRAAGAAAQSLLSGPLPDLGELIRSVQAAQTEGAAALKSGDVAIYALVSRMAPDYRAVDAAGKGPGQSRDDVLQAEKDLLAKHRYTDIEAGITSLTLTAPDAATVTLWHRATYITTGTPPTYLKTPGGIAVINNTSRATTVELLEQTWRRDASKGWQVSRSRVVQAQAVAVL